MTAEERAQLGEAWLAMGLTEHASVAAFARFVLHLLSLAAPPDLVQDAIRAMADEVEHARLCFALAQRVTGEAAGPGLMNLAGIFAKKDDPAAILRAAILEGCFEETISARCVQAALERTVDDAVRAALTRIVEDESRHAALSWRFVTWMLRTYPEHRQEAEECFTLALQARNGDTTATGGCAVLETHGHLLPPSVAQVREATIEGEIRSRIVELLGRVPTLS